MIELVGKYHGAEVEELLQERALFICEVDVGPHRQALGLLLGVEHEEPDGLPYYRVAVAKGFKFWEVWKIGVRDHRQAQSEARRGIRCHSVAARAERKADDIQLLQEDRTLWDATDSTPATPK